MAQVVDNIKHYRHKTHVLMTIPRRTYTLFGLAALAPLCYWYFPTAISFADRWNTLHEAYSHGYLLLGLCGLLIVRQLPGLMHAGKSPYWPAIIPLFAFSLLWLFGRVTHVLVLQQLTLPALGLLAITSVYGLNAGKKLRFPFLLFYAAVPVWDIFNGVLQSITVKVCTLGLDWVGVPAFIEQNQITIPAGTFQVAGGCSGLSYLLITGIIGAVYGHLYYRLNWHKVLLLAVAVVFGLLCNWIRVFSLVVIGHISDMQSSLMVDHEILGWVAFTLCLPPYLYIAMHIETLDDYLQPATDSSRVLPQPRLHWFAVATVAAITAIFGPLWYASIKPHIAHGNLASVLKDSQSTLIEYAKQPRWEPAYRKMDEHLVLQFPGKFPEMQIHIVTYFSQGQGKELIQWDNNISDNRKWKLRSEQSITSPEGDPLKLVSLQSMTGNAEIIYWYAIGDYSTNSELKAKGYQLLAFLQGREDASLLAIFYHCAGGNCSRTRASAVESVAKIKLLYIDAMKKLTEVDQHPAQ